MFNKCFYVFHMCLHFLHMCLKFYGNPGPPPPRKIIIPQTKNCPPPAHPRPSSLRITQLSEFSVRGMACPVSTLGYGVADIYTLFNFLEKNKIFLSNNLLSKKILICLFPILPKLSSSINKFLFKSESFDKWPEINPDLLIEDDINLPIQIQGKMVKLNPLANI